MYKVCEMFLIKLRIFIKGCFLGDYLIRVLEIYVVSVVYKDVE